MDSENMTERISIYYGPEAKNGFSFRRVLDYAWLYMSSIRSLTLWFGLTSLVLALLMVMPFNQGLQTGFFTMAKSSLGIMFVCSPLIFAKHGDSQVLERIAPVRPDEKLVFYLLFTYVYMPVVLYLLPSISAIIVVNTSLCHDVVRIMVDRLLRWDAQMAFAVAQDLMIPAVCLYFVLSSRHSRIFKGVLALLGCWFVLMLQGVIMGYSMAASGAIEPAAEVAQSDPALAVAQAIDRNAAEFAAHPWLMWGPTIGCVVVFIIAVVMIYKVLKKRGK